MVGGNLVWTLGCGVTPELDTIERDRERVACERPEEFGPFSIPKEEKKIGKWISRSLSKKKKELLQRR